MDGYIVADVQFPRIDDEDISKAPLPAINFLSFREIFVEKKRGLMTGLRVENFSYFFFQLFVVLYANILFELLRPRLFSGKGNGKKH
jgi:hypothetical protein